MITNLDNNFKSLFVIKYNNWLYLYIRVYYEYYCRYQKWIAMNDYEIKDKVNGIIIITLLAILSR